MPHPATLPRAASYRTQVCCGYRFSVNRYRGGKGDVAEERLHAKTVPYCSLGTPRAASQSHTAVYWGGGVAPRSVNSWRCFDNSFISVVRSSAAYLKSALRFNSSSAST